jgi:hypothetical protein
LQARALQEQPAQQQQQELRRAAWQRRLPAHWLAFHLRQQEPALRLAQQAQR